MATLSWSDTFEPGTSYAIEQKGQDGTWSSVDAVPGTTGMGSSLTWSRTINATTTLRVSVQKIGYEVPLDTASGASSVQVVVPASAPTIVLGQVPPISGTANASISGGGTYSSVSYYLDLNLAGTSTTGPSYSAALDTSGLTAGPHLILARLAAGPDTYIELRLQVQVANPEVAVAVKVVGAGTAFPITSGPGKVSVAATSAYSITSVTASLDGKTLGTLKAPNGCEVLLCVTLDHYQFPIDTTVVGSGSHTITAQATDANGATSSRVITVVFSNPPTISLTSPFDGELVNGNLQIAGTFKTDRASTTVSFSVTLGSLPMVNTSTSPFSFSTSFSLAGVTPGSYTLTATATDSGGLTTTVTDTVTVTSSPSLVYQPIVTIGAGGSLVTAGGAYILYSPPDGSMHLRSGNTDTTLPLGAIQAIGFWTVTDGGYVLTSGSERNPNLNYSIYMWPPGGTAKNLSSAAQTTGSDDQLLAVHYPWVLWTSYALNQNGNEYVFYNVTTGQQLQIQSPANMVLGNIYSDFFVANGNITLFYWQDKSSTSGSSDYNVLRWDQATNTSVAITSDGLSVYPQTDGTGVAWQTRPSSGAGPYTLTTMDLASSTTKVLSTTLVSFQLSSGLLGWMDQTLSGFTVTGQAINAWDGTTASPVSTLPNTVFFGSSGGYIFFEEGGKLYAWSSSGGRQILFDAAPGQVRLTGKTVYFTNGTSQAVYGVRLP